MDNKTIALNIARYRGDLSQSYIAQQMKKRGYTNWAQSTVSGIEKGERAIKLNEAVDLASVLGVTLESLVADGDDPQIKVQREIKEAHSIVLDDLDSIESSFSWVLEGVSNLEKLVSVYESLGLNLEDFNYCEARDFLKDRKQLWDSLRFGISIALGYSPELPVDDETALKALGYPGVNPEDITLTELAKKQSSGD